jgi:A/G-specific adenine glycosylase
MPIRAALIERMQTALLEHFDRHARDLPWRRCRTPYSVWISEIMLQQTRVETVIPYFERWMETFPSVSDLATAGETEVLKAWEGLGYYARARNALKTARVVRERRAGVFPETAEELGALPGIGEYTSGAISSIAFGACVPAVDGNVRRVLSRLFDLEDASGREIRDHAAALVPADRPGDWNEALMELGATVCAPRTPDCDACPLSADCKALSAGTVDVRPAPRTRARTRAVTFVSLVALDERDRFFMARRRGGGLLAGLWEFPTAVLNGDEAGTMDRLAAAHGLRIVGSPHTLPDVRHTFTHLRATYRPMLTSAAEGSETEEAKWRSLDEAVSLPLPVAQRRILETARSVIGAASSSA